ncbi:MAG TPA: hypothetical protein VHA53_06250 [Nitrolancea sp.]|nr:hypothetical protein [Nitrolancea sp.]
MERWEPPASSEASPRSTARSSLTRVRGQDSVPESIEMAIARLAIAAYFFLPSSDQTPSFWISVVGPILVIVLIGMGTLQTRWGSPLSRTSWLFDGLTLGILTPILVINAFAATGDGPISSSERSVYLATVVGATIVLVGLVMYGSRLSGLRAYTWGILLLPCALTGVALLAPYDDYKTTSIVLALSLAWFVTVPVTIIAHSISGVVAAIFPAISYVLFVIAIVAITGSGLTFGGRPAPVSVVHPVLLFVLGVALLAPLLPEPRPLAPKRRRTPQRRRTAAARQRRSRPRTASPDDEPFELDDLEDFRS